MTGWQKLKRINSSLFLLILLALVTGCEKEEEKVPVEKVVVQVGQSKLTENELEQMLEFSQNKSKFRDEVIVNWIETELLFQAAEGKNILEDSLYKQISSTSNKKLAGTLFLKNYMSNYDSTINQAEIEKYFQNHKHEFALDQEAFLYNLIELDFELFFTDSKSYSLFEGLTKDLSENPLDSMNVVRVFKERSEIQSDKILNALDTLKINEISIIPNTEPGIVSIVQLTKKYQSGDVPEFDIIKSLVEERFRDYRKMILYDSLINDLYSKYDVIINR